MKHDQTECLRPKRVAIVGAGNVGSTAAYSLMLDGTVDELALIDLRVDKVTGDVLDLQHGMQFTRSVEVEGSDSLELVANADIVVIAAGAAQHADQKREDLVIENAKVFSSIVPEIVKHNSNCIILVVTNPLDAMTYLTWKLSGLPSCRVFGTGTVLDTARLRYLLGQRLNMSPKDITAYILGEHGPSEFAWWSSANIAGVPLSEFTALTQSHRDEIFDQVRSAADTIIKLKGATFYAIAMVITRIVRALLLDQSRVLTVSTIDEDAGVSISVPTVIRKGGVCERLPLVLDQQERESFQRCSQTIASTIKRSKLLS